MSGFLQIPYHRVTNRATIVQSYSKYWLNVHSDVVTLASAVVTTKPTTTVPDTTKAATTTSVATDKVSSFDLYTSLYCIISGQHNSSEFIVFAKCWIHWYM